MRGTGVAVSAMTLVVVAASCASAFDEERDPAVAVVSHASGRRLRAQVVTVDGVAVFRGWVDTKLGVRCSFAPAEDGTLRCLPRFSGAPLHCPELVGARPVATNADEETACAGTFPELPNESSYLGITKYENCGTVTTIVRLGEPVTPSGPCRENIKARPPRFEFRAAVQVDPAELVTATERIEQRGALAVSVLVANDGAREVRTMVDPKTGRTCAPPGEDAGPCASDVAWVSGVALDATCSRPVAQMYASCGAPSLPRVAVRYRNCGGVELLAPGREIPPAEISRTNLVGECVHQPPTASVYYETAGPLPPGTFPEARTTLVGSGRVRLRAWTAETGELLTARSLFDTELGETCDETLIEGVRRCVPPSVQSATSYADEHCTVPLVAVYPDACAPPATLALRRLDCGWSIHRIGGRYEGPVFRIESGGLCASTSSRAQYFGLAERIDPSRFVQLLARQE